MSFQPIRKPDSLPLYYTLAPKGEVSEGMADISSNYVKKPFSNIYEFQQRHYALAQGNYIQIIGVEGFESSVQLIWIYIPCATNEKVRNCKLIKSCRAHINPSSKCEEVHSFFGVSTGV